MMILLQMVLMKKMKIGPVILVSVYLKNGSKGKRRQMKAEKSSTQVIVHINLFHLTIKLPLVALLKFDAIYQSSLFNTFKCMGTHQHTHRVYSANN